MSRRVRVSDCVECGGVCDERARLCASCRDDPSVRRKTNSEPTLAELLAIEAEQRLRLPAWFAQDFPDANRVVPRRPRVFTIHKCR